MLPKAIKYLLMLRRFTYRSSGEVESEKISLTVAKDFNSGWYWSVKFKAIILCQVFNYSSHTLDYIE